MTLATAGREWTVLRWRCACGFGVGIVVTEPVASLTLAAVQGWHAEHGPSGEVERAVIVETEGGEEVDGGQTE